MPSARMRTRFQGPEGPHAYASERTPGEVPNHHLRVQHQGLRKEVRQEQAHTHPLQGYHGVRLLPRQWISGREELQPRRCLQEASYLSPRGGAKSTQQPKEEPWRHAQGFLPTSGWYLLDLLGHLRQCARLLRAFG